MCTVQHQAENGALKKDYRIFWPHLLFLFVSSSISMEKNNFFLWIEKNNFTYVYGMECMVWLLADVAHMYLFFFSLWQLFPHEIYDNDFDYYGYNYDSSCDKRGK